MVDLTGRVLGERYKVVAFVGRGGMADVYRVWDLHRSVSLALKMLHEDLADDLVFLRRFKREAQTLEKLQHPHIVRFYGLEEADDQAFMLMDFVDGSTLRKEIARQKGPMPLERAREILRPVCAALHYAHQMGIAHCDVKPANIMIHNNGTVLVADFGISRLTEAVTTMTMAGAGTPAYMAPEQVRGENPTPQTDIYALGIVLYEMLTGGERPFTGEMATITGSTSEKVRWEQVNLNPISPRRINPAISAEMETVVLKCLAKEPAQRYPSALELLQAVEWTAQVDVGIGQSVLASDRPTVSLSTETDLFHATGNEQAAQRTPERLANYPSAVPEQPSTVRSIPRRIPGWLVSLLLGLILVITLAGVIASRNDKPLSAETELALIATEPLPTAIATASLTWTLIPTQTPTWTQAPSQTLVSTKTDTPTQTPKPTREAGATMISPINGMVWVYIPAGEFQMGSNDGDSDEQPIHTVYLDAFWIGQTEVTNEQYKKCVAAGECTLPKKPRSYYRDEWFNTYPALETDVNIIGLDKYCSWVGGRRPTEAEWEKAARGGVDGKEYPWGDELPVCQAGAVNGANFTGGIGCTGTGPVPVASYAPNSYGLYDMAGNVWERVRDMWVPYTPEYQENPVTELVPGADYVLRGGSWVEQAFSLRVANRFVNVSYRYDNIGARCVMYLGD